MKKESDLWRITKKKTAKINWTRLESWSSFGVPDLLGYHDSCGFFMCELKLARSPKISFSPHQILFHQVHQKRNFILVGVGQEAIHGPRKANEIRLYSSSSILGLLTDYRETPALATCALADSWVDIEQKFLNTPLD